MLHVLIILPLLFIVKAELRGDTFQQRQFRRGWVENSGEIQLEEHYRLHQRTHDEEEPHIKIVRQLRSKSSSGDAVSIGIAGSMIGKSSKSSKKSSNKSTKKSGKGDNVFGKGKGGKGKGGKGSSSDGGGGPSPISEPNVPDTGEDFMPNQPTSPGGPPSGPTTPPSPTGPTITPEPTPITPEQPSESPPSLKEPPTIPPAASPTPPPAAGPPTNPPAGAPRGEFNDGLFGSMVGLAEETEFAYQATVTPSVTKEELDLDVLGKVQTLMGVGILSRIFQQCSSDAVAQQSKENQENSQSKARDNKNPWGRRLRNLQTGQLEGFSVKPKDFVYDGGKCLLVSIPVVCRCLFLTFYFFLFQLSVSMLSPYFLALSSKE
jgi:hypothetical protein